MANEGMSPQEVVEECNRLIMDHRALEAVEKYIAKDFIETVRMYATATLRALSSTSGRLASPIRADRA